MRQIHFRIMTLVVLLGASVALLNLNRATTLAIGGGRYELGWYAMGFGGGVSAGGNYAMSSTVGQADADELTGGTYTLGSGFRGGKRVVIPVTPTSIPTVTATATATATPTATLTPAVPAATATPTTSPTPWALALLTATPTQVGEPSPTATSTPPGGSAPTATPTPLGSANGAARLYLPLLRR